MEVPFIISLKTFPEIPGNIRIAMTSAENPIRQKKGSKYKNIYNQFITKTFGNFGKPVGIGKIK